MFSILSAARVRMGVAKNIHSFTRLNRLVVMDVSFSIGKVEWRHYASSLNDHPNIVYPRIALLPTSTTTLARCLAPRPLP